MKLNTDIESNFNQTNDREMKFYFGTNEIRQVSKKNQKRKVLLLRYVHVF